MRIPLKFCKISDGQAAAKMLSARLTKELTAKKRVLWLVSGGSNIAIEVAVMQRLPANLQPYLAIMLTDERYGKFGHKNSNLQQLYDAGFAPGKATVVPVLMPEYLSLDDCVARYRAVVEAVLANADIIIAQFGIGADGHIAGLLPGSAALKVPRLVDGFEAKDFMRVTLTPPALKRISVAFAFVYGRAKREALKNLRDKNLPLAEQPAQILKQIPEAYVYNDQIGEKS
ncbi:MAG TPA: 6-phosphogluconolactonase [Candidatus Saccharimonadales bacterium]